MATLLWDAWGTQWLSGRKVDFDGLNKLIIVHPEVTELDIRADVYTAWVDWLYDQEYDSRKWPLALKYSGMDPIPGGETGGTFFTIKGWKLVVDIKKVVITGVLFSEDYTTPYYDPAQLAPVFAVQVAALVSGSITTVTQVVEVPANPNDVRDAVWGASMATVTSTSGSIGEYIGKKLLTVAKFLGLK